MSESSAAETIAEFRRLIAEVDAALVASINRRIELVAELKRFKENRAVAFVDPEQERRLVAELAKANPGPLSEEGLLEVVAAILAVTKREVAALDDRGRIDDSRPPGIV